MKKLLRNTFSFIWFIFKNIYLFFFCKCRYGFSVCKSFINKPLRIVNSSHIYIYSCCNIMPLARLETIRNYANKELDGKLIIKDYVSIGQGVHIIAADELIIEKHATLSSYVFISDCHHSYEDIDTPIMHQPLLVKRVHIGEGCLIGRGVAILAGASIGKHSVIGANSVVTSEIPDYCVAVGIPAKIIKKYNFEKKCWVKV